MEISIKNLNKTYPGGFQALDGIDLTINEGMFGLLGPNGAGKSTLMRILVTLMKATSGEVLVDGRDINSYRKEIRTLVGYLPQDFRRFFVSVVAGFLFPGDLQVDLRVFQGELFFLYFGTGDRILQALGPLKFILFQLGEKQILQGLYLTLLADRQ